MVYPWDGLSLGWPILDSPEVHMLQVRQGAAAGKGVVGIACSRLGYLCTRYLQCPLAHHLHQLAGTIAGPRLQCGHKAFNMAQLWAQSLHGGTIVGPSLQCGHGIT